MSGASRRQMDRLQGWLAREVSGRDLSNSSGSRRACAGFRCDGLHRRGPARATRVRGPIKIRLAVRAPE
jgi:hypothetical protein